MKRIATLMTGAALGVALLTGCGGDDGGDGGDGGSAGGSDYCDTLESARDEISALDTGDSAALVKIQEIADDLQDDAPDEVKADWGVLNDAFDQIDAALEEAGLEMEDLATLESGQLPEGVDQQKLQQAMTELTETMQGLGEEFEAAGESITKHAKDECDIDLDESSSESPSSE